MSLIFGDVINKSLEILTRGYGGIKNSVISTIFLKNELNSTAFDRGFMDIVGI